MGYIILYFQMSRKNQNYLWSSCEDYRGTRKGIAENGCTVIRIMSVDEAGILKIIASACHAEHVEELDNQNTHSSLLS